MTTRSLRWSRPLAVIAAVAAVALTSPAHADGPTPDTDAARISAAGHSLKSNVTATWAGRAGVYGHAETLIHAPEAKVRQLVLDYGSYHDLASSITTSRVVGHDPDGSAKVYLQMGVLNNMFHLWDVTRFAPPRPDGGDEIVEGRKISGQGNIDDAVLAWRLHPVGSDWTVLKFDLLLDPGIPGAPKSLVEEQLRDSAMDAVNSIHDRAQGNKDFVAYAP